jgi:translation initiation factor 5B
MIRQPIVSVLGHVDHGKTLLLDHIRGSAVVEREAGGITQHIGATEIPLEVIEKICGGLMKQLKIEVTLPGLLFIDTPGHAAFTTLRRRGGALADFAILVVDINEGFQPQTVEALNILRTYKTPFLVAANKIDRLMGWQVFNEYPFAHSFLKQSDEVRQTLENKIYELVGLLYEHGHFEAERFDRVKDFTKQVPIVPVSALTGEGVPELMMMLIGLSQKFLTERLDIVAEKPGRGTILEVKEEVGLGTTVDVIIYDGKIKRGDTIVLGGKKGVITTKVRSLLKPKPLDEIRDPRFKFDNIKEMHASCGIKVAAPDLKDALAGTPLWVAESKKAEKEVEGVRAEIEEVKVETERAGVVVKADTLGGLEALINLLNEAGIPIKRADVGDITKRDIIDAGAVAKEEALLGTVMGFNVKMLKDAETLALESGVPVFTSDIIYQLIENYEDWVEMEKEREKASEFDHLTKPGKVRFLPGYVFRQSKPAVIGVEVLLGRVRPNLKLINGNGETVGTIKGLQDRGENIPEAEKGREVAMAIQGPVVGRQINEGDIFYVDIPEPEARLLSGKNLEYLTEDEREALAELKAIKRRTKPFWGEPE